MPTHPEFRGVRRGQRRYTSSHRTAQEYLVGPALRTAQQAARTAFGTNHLVVRTTRVTHRGDAEYRVVSTQIIEGGMQSSAQNEDDTMEDAASGEQRQTQGQALEERPYTRDIRSFGQRMATLPLPPSQPPRHDTGHSTFQSKDASEKDHPPRTDADQHDYNKPSRPDNPEPGIVTTEASRVGNDPSSKLEAAESSQIGRSWLPWSSSGRSDKEEQLYRVNKDLQDQSIKYQKRIETLTKMNSLQKAKISRQEDNIMSFTEQVRQFSESQRELESQILVAQAAMSKSAARPRTGLAEEERTIKGNFENLQNDVKKWGKTWGNTPFSTIKNLSAVQLQNFLQQLSNVAVLENGQIPEILKSEDMSTRSSILCVSALLGRNICIEVMEDPFRALKALTNPVDKISRLVDEEDDTLQVVYEKLSLLDEPKAQVWRSDMLTILDPSSIDSFSERTLQAQKEAANRRENAANELSASFLTGNVEILLRSVEPEDVVRRHEQLQSIFRQALEMAGRLWKQLTIVKCDHLEDLKKDCFSYESELMEAHVFHKLGFDDGSEHRLDGSPIRLVVFPAVKGYGNSDGANYLQQRVWGKAIVWLDE